MPHRDPAKEKYWRRLLRQWRRSGLTARDFCAVEGVSEPSFYSWRRELDRRDQRDKVATKHASTSLSAPALRAKDLATPAFIQLAMDAPATSSPVIEVVLAERRLLRVRPGFDADLLRQLVRLLEEPSC